jgi:hypothetical protein
MSALVLARRIDNPITSATAVSACTDSLAARLKELRELAPPETIKDELEELRGRYQSARSG